MGTVLSECGAFEGNYFFILDGSVWNIRTITHRILNVSYIFLNGAFVSNYQSLRDYNKTNSTSDEVLFVTKVARPFIADEL